eukprot:1743840-Amphidinium_carterae.1
MEWPHVSGHDNQCFWRSLVHMLAGCERPEGALEPVALKQQVMQSAALAYDALSAATLEPIGDVTD